MDDFHCATNVSMASLDEEIRYRRSGRRGPLLSWVSTMWLGGLMLLIILPTRIC
jgi:hypothetical protein